MLDWPDAIAVIVVAIVIGAVVSVEHYTKNDGRKAIIQECTKKYPIDKCKELMKELK